MPYNALQARFLALSFWAYNHTNKRENAENAIQTALHTCIVIHFSLHIAFYFIQYTMIIHIQCIEKAFFMRLCSQYAYLSIQICRLPLFAFLSSKYMQAQARKRARIRAYTHARA